MFLELDNLHAGYGRVEVLHGVSLHVDEGEIVSILGANGAGKTTLMNLITDNVRRDAGEILFNGTDVLKLGKRFRSVLGYMPQQQGMYPDFSARAFLLYMAELKEIPRKQAREQVEALLEMVNLQDAAHKKLGGFSGGMRQRVLLAQALLGDTAVLILDEPSAGLDPRERLRIRKYIAQLASDRIVFLTTHIVSDIESIAKDVLLMKQGKLVTHGAPEALIESVGGGSLEDVYLSYLGED